jgi:hypothetical protein
MDTQLDQIANHSILRPLQHMVLSALQKRMQTPQQDQWLENFLAVFILLSSIEASSRHGEKFALDFGIRVSQTANHL